MHFIITGMKIALINKQFCDQYKLVCLFGSKKNAWHVELAWHTCNSFFIFLRGKIIYQTMLRSMVALISRFS